MLEDWNPSSTAFITGPPFSATWEGKYAMFLITKYLTMLMPELQGNCTQKQFFIYTACDTEYFDEFGHGIIASIQKNTNMGVHVHLYNPRSDQLEYCKQQPRLSITWEYVPVEYFKPAADAWNTVPQDPVRLDQYNRTLNAMSKGNDVDIQHRMQRTYYACARFIRLEQMLAPSASVLAIDSDAIVRSNIPVLGADKDFYLHHISGKKARYLAGGIYLTGSDAGRRFLKQYSNSLLAPILQDNLYWGLDQDVLNHLVPQYNHGQLPMSLIDWEMRLDSHIWTAKGRRKELAVFVNELKKYSL
jgi:hypothetical protein